MTEALDPLPVALRPFLDLPGDLDLSATIAAFHAAGLTDGLPIVPPSEAAIEAMLGGRNPLAAAISQPLPIAFAVPTWWDLAALAVMAGCPLAPALLGVVAAALDGCADPAFNLLGVQATTGAASPLVIVHGAAERLGFNAGASTMGPGGPMNAPVGRAVRLALQNIGCARPGEADMATLGHPGKVGWLVAENRAASPWEPFLGAESGPGDPGRPGPVDPGPGESGPGDAGPGAPVPVAATSEQAAVTVFPGVGNVEVVLPTTTPDAVAGRLTEVLCGLAAPGNVVLVPPDAAVFLHRHGWGREALVGALSERTGRRPLVVVTGGAGVKAAVVPGWGGPCAAVTRAVEPWTRS
jgi:hypothetical protein